jgi:uncharacterized protein
MRRLTEQELDRLDTFLGEIDNDDAMLLTSLDGFLCAIVVSPELITPGEWLPAVWGREDGVFANMEEANEILGLVMARYNEIVHDLNGRGQFEPILEIDDDETALWEIWIEGFSEAVALRPQSWLVYGEAEDADVRRAFEVLAGLIEISLMDDEAWLARAEDIGEDAHEIIADCLEALNAARLKMNGTPRKPATSLPAGRNDSCPCGSGKTFKTCCMN